MIVELENLQQLVAVLATPVQGVVRRAVAHREGRDALELAAQRARELSVEEFVAAARADIEADVDARDAAVYAFGAPLEQTYAGLARYWSKLGGAR